METKKNKILQNVKTKLISILGLTKRSMTKYWMFSMNMVLDNPKNQQAKMNYEHLCDL
jgi:hypothetical protein